MSPRPLGLLAAAVLLVVAAPSHADLIIDAPRKAPSRVVVKQSMDPAKRAPVVKPQGAHVISLDAGPVSYAKVDRIVETGGKRTADATKVVTGWADDVPLDLALAQVVPADWSIYSVQISGDKVVSWSGGRPWTQLLGDLAYRGGFAANIQWDHRRVVIYPAGQPAPGSASLVSARVVRGSPVPTRVATGVPCCAPKKVHSETRLKVSEAVGKPVVASSPVVIKPVVAAEPVQTKKWLIDPRLSLKQNVEAWARQAGWSAVVWEAADYEMVAPAVFEGDFTSKDGPLAKLIAAYADSDQPLQVELLTRDRVVHVTNKNYQPAVVVPMVPSQIVPSSFEK